MKTQSPENYLPLHGVRILDMATVVAAPLGATLCADLGADTVKLELPDGTDPLRTLAPVIDGKAVWWKVANRGKRGISLDVRKPAGRDLFLKLIPDFDVLIENFRTGTLEKWDLAPKTLHQVHPRLTIIRLTGFGQTGPYSARPGFARVFEAMTSFTSLTAGADGAPLHADFPLGDAVAGLYTAFSVAAEIARLRGDPQATGRVIDLSASEALIRLLDPIPAEFVLQGKTRKPRGSSASYTAPSNIYRSEDGVYFSMAASSDEMFRRLTQAFQRPQWLSDPRFATNKARMSNSEAINEQVAALFASMPFRAIERKLTEVSVPFSKVNTIADVMQDPHFSERNTFVQVPDADFGHIPSPCVVPRAVGMSSPTPTAGPDVGQHNAEVYGQLGLATADLQKLKDEGVI